MKRDAAPAACCHDDYEWFDETLSWCPACRITNAFWAAIPPSKRGSRRREAERNGPFLPAPPITEPDVLSDAHALIRGQRRSDYGDPETNFGRIAALWSVVLQHEVTPVQVAQCMAQLKLARLIHTPDHHDSWVDAAGYIGLGSHLATTTTTQETAK
ncbi:DUF6378 domain-containing protein [Gordonia sp. MMO-8]|uniref:DUF6378 domain-containing protein n=1 Tax=Gordonia sp. MMO-8 TaxID=3127886 RepID=UPI0030163A32